MKKQYFKVEFKVYVEVTSETEYDAASLAEIIHIAPKVEANAAESTEVSTLGGDITATMLSRKPRV